MEKSAELYRSQIWQSFFKTAKPAFSFLIVDGNRDNHILTDLPICRRCNAFTSRELKRIKRPDDFGKISANRHGICHRQLELLVWPDNENRSNSMLMPSAEREKALLNWAAAPSARLCHPREEHLMPLHVVAGAATGGNSMIDFNDTVLGAKISAYQFQ